MSNKLRKTPSFTVIELIMALLISSVVIGIVYYIYLLFNNQFNRSQEKSIAMQEFLIFQKALQTDIERADAINASTENEVIFRNSMNGQPIQYNFNDSNIVRTAGEIRDSFEVRNNGCQATTISDSSFLVDKLVLKITVADASFNALYKKQYSACQLMNQEQDHE